MDEKKDLDTNIQTFRKEVKRFITKDVNTFYTLNMQSNWGEAKARPKLQASV